MTDKRYAVFNGDYEPKQDVDRVFEARDCEDVADYSDLYFEDELVHSAVPNELLVDVEPNFILELGRPMTCRANNGKRFTFEKGTQLLKVTVQEKYPEYAVFISDEFPIVLMGHSYADKHYRSPYERTLIIRKK